MPGIKIKENESFENALRRFKKQVEKTGILSEVRKREHFEKPSIKRKKKALAAKKRAMNPSRSTPASNSRPAQKSTTAAALAAY